MKEFPPRPGVYAIINRQNQKMYVGSSVNIQSRILGHVSALRLGNHYNVYLQRAWNKYSEDGFEVKILELVDNSDDLYLREGFWISEKETYHRDKGYNLIHVTKEGRRLLSVETKEKIGGAIKRSFQNMGVEEKVRRSIINRENKKGKKGYHLSLSTRNKISDARKKWFENMVIEEKERISVINRENVLKGWERRRRYMDGKQLELF